MADHIHTMHNNTEEKLRVEEKKTTGRFKKLVEIPKNDKHGPLDGYALTDLRFVVKSNRRVYFRFIEGVHDSGKIQHIDGETGHPGDDG